MEAVREETTEDIRVMFPISGEQVNRLGLDAVNTEDIYGTVLTLPDIQRGYHRWKTLMDAPDVSSHDLLEPAVKTMLDHISKADSDLDKARLAVETAKAKILEKVSEISDLETKLRMLASEKNTMKDLADKRLSEMTKVNKSKGELQRTVDRYKRRYGSAENNLNFLQRFIIWVFRI